VWLEVPGRDQSLPDPVAADAQAPAGHGHVARFLLVELHECGLVDFGGRLGVLAQASFRSPAALVAADLAGSIWDVAQLSLRQALIPDRLLGRVAAHPGEESERSGGGGWQQRRLGVLL
jgi:hypothetical protein